LPCLVSEVSGALPLLHRIEESFVRRLEALPDEARLLLLVTDRAGRQSCARASDLPEALEPAMKNGLAEIERLDERARKRAVGTLEDLTAQEARIPG
jgi:hypothetical protein